MYDLDFDNWSQTPIYTSGDCAIISSSEWMSVACLFKARCFCQTGNGGEEVGISVMIMSHLGLESVMRWAGDGFGMLGGGDGFRAFGYTGNGLMRK